MSSTLTGDQSKGTQAPVYSLPPMAFTDSVFHGPAVFNNRRLNYQTAFGNCQFLGSATFFDTLIPEGVDFAGADFELIEGHAAASYMTLRRVMEERRDRREEGRFYALEMRCRRTLDPKPEAFLSWLYDETCLYGQSITRPVRVLIEVSILFLTVYALLFYSALPVEFLRNFFKDPFEVLGGLTAFTVDQMVRPFGIWSG